MWQTNFELGFFLYFERLQHQVWARSSIKLRSTLRSLHHVKSKVKMKWKTSSSGTEHCVAGDIFFHLPSYSFNTSPFVTPSHPLSGPDIVVCFFICGGGLSLVTQVARRRALTLTLALSQSSDSAQKWFETERKRERGWEKQIVRVGLKKKNFVSVWGSTHNE